MRSPEVRPVGGENLSREVQYRAQFDNTSPSAHTQHSNEVVAAANRIHGKRVATSSWIERPIDRSQRETSRTKCCSL